MKQYHLILVPVAIVFLSACGTQKDIRKTTEEDAGAVSARALNRLANSSPESLIKIATALEKSGNLKEASNVYTQALAVTPNHLGAQLGIARIMIATGQREAALKSLNDIQENHTLSAQNKTELAKLYMDLQHYDQSLALVEPLTAQSTGRQIAFVGILHELKGNSTKARELFDRARRQQGIAESFSKLIAYSFALDGAYETAVALLQPILNNQTTREDGRMALAYIYAMSGQYQPAVKLMRSVHGDDYVKSRQTMIKMLPLMNRQEKAEVLLFERVRAETVKRLLPIVKK